jgi:hypothetical protein
VKADIQDTHKEVLGCVGFKKIFGGNANMYEMDQYTVSLLHFDDGIKDESGKVWTANGGAAINTAKTKFGASSLFLNGTNQYLTTSSSYFDFGSEDFTIDWWEYRTSNNGDNQPVFCRDNNVSYQAFLVGVCNSQHSNVSCFFSSDNSSWNITGATGKDMGPVILNAWTHYAVVRKGNNFYTFQNGTLQSTWYSSAALAGSTGVPGIGKYNTQGYFPGYIDEFRVSNIARWTSDFNLKAPANLTATAGDSQVTLTWTAVTGATGYNVKRSTAAGGPYMTIASNVSGTSYVDATVTNGTTYYYVVTTVNADGESANSNEASATPVASSKALLRVTMSDSSEREYQLSESEIDGFINWVKGHVSADPNCYMLNKIEVLQNSKDYLMFEKIISFEVMPLTK